MTKKGFTLIEMITVVSIISIITLMAVPSIFSLLENARQVVRTEAAKTIYLAAQNQMTQLRALGNFKSAYEGNIAGGYFEVDDTTNEYTDELNLSSPVFELNNVYNALTFGADTFYPTNDLENGRAGYVRYLSKPAGLDETHPLHLFLSPVIIDEEILEGTILIEYNISTGKVLSVFYSDLDDTSEFSYTIQDNSSQDIYGERAELYNDTANDRRQGYYGVDYSGTQPPESSTEVAIHLYDGYEDGHDDSLILPELSRYNRPLDSISIDNPGDNLENVLYAEIFIEKSILTVGETYDLGISALDEVVIQNFDFSALTNTSETFEDALNFFNDGTRNAFIYRSDSIFGHPDYARFIWVIDYIGGDMSAENDDRYMYSIASIEDVSGNRINFEDLTDVNVSVTQNDMYGSSFTVTSNEKNPLFADNDNDPTLDPDLIYNNIATARHLNNIRHQYDFANEDYIYTQIENIDLASENEIIEIDSSFAEVPSGDSEPDDYAWNLKLSPLPELHGKYTGFYSVAVSETETEEGAYTIQNLYVFDINDDTTADDTTGASAPSAINHSVGLFEKIAGTGEISHLMFIDPLIEVKDFDDTTTVDNAKYAGVVTGYSNGSIHHITVMSNSEISPVLDIDSTSTSAVDYDSNITDDYVGGIVGMVGNSTNEDALHHLLYLAAAPSEEVGETDSVVYDHPIIGTNLKLGLTAATATSDEDMLNFAQSGDPDGYVLKAIDNDSCYFLSGKLLRPYDDDLDDDGTPDSPAAPHSNINVEVVTSGLGNAISTSDMYIAMNDTRSDFYLNFMTGLDEDGDSEVQYGFVRGISNPLAVSDGANPSEEYVSSLVYPYPYYGDYLPNADMIDESDVDKDLNFIWPVTDLEDFDAEFLYYEVYGNVRNVDEPEVGIYQLNSSGNVIVNTLIDTDVDTDYEILNDGYAIKVNQPYTMLEREDFVLSINDTTIPKSELSDWLNMYPETANYDDFTDNLLEGSIVTGDEFVMTLNNETLSNAVDTARGENTGVLKIAISSRGTSEATSFINPLYAKAILNTDLGTTADITYSVRTERHLNNIGYYNNSESENSSFVQELDIDLSSFGEDSSVDVADWTYNSLDPTIIYNALKFSEAMTSTSSGLNIGATIASINVPFEGTYNGNGHSIDNFTKETTDENVALFNSTTDTGIIQNLNVNNFDITSKGNGVAATLVANNAGAIENVSVSDSIVLATASIDAGGDVENRPTNVGGIVALNTGSISNASISNSQVNRHEVASPVAPDILSFGVGGLVGSNSGNINNSGVTNTTVTAFDNFVGGLVGIATGTNSVIEDSYFVHDGEDGLGNPVIPISFDTTATLDGVNPRNSIGGIVGGIVYDETVGTTVVNDTGIIRDTLYLAVAPSSVVTSYPLVGAFSDGFITLENNVYLTGTQYSADNTSWNNFNYNTLTHHLPTSALANALLGLPSYNINITWLATSNGQLNGWTTHVGNIYPTPAGVPAFSDVPYAQ